MKKKVLFPQLSLTLLVAKEFRYVIAYTGVLEVHVKKISVVGDDE
jgi:hypothetical protein